MKTLYGHTLITCSGPKAVTFITLTMAARNTIREKSHTWGNRDHAYHPELIKLGLEIRKFAKTIEERDELRNVYGMRQFGARK